MTRVEVYWNLHKDCWSVRKPNGRVLYHMEVIYLQDVKWVVQPAGKERVVREKRKNVHAFARGWLSTYPELPKNLGPEHGVTYNPYKYNTFVDVDCKFPVKESDAASFYITPNGKPRATYQETQ